MSSVARIPSKCATCDELGSLEVDQAIRNGQLRWVERFSCECGHSFEAAGVGQPTKALRAALIKQVGRGEVWLDDAKGREVVSKVLVRAFAMKEAQVTKLLKKLPAVAYEGTHNEARFLSLALERLGVKVRLVLHLPK